jgi:hypothetical protein
LTVDLLLAGNGNAFLFPFPVSTNDETETRFCFHVQLHGYAFPLLLLESLSVVNSAKMGPAKLPAIGRFACGQKIGFPLCHLTSGLYGYTIDQGIRNS